MNDELRQKAITAALNRRVPQDRESLDKEIEAKTNWTAYCPKCAMPLRGTLIQIKEHKCASEGK